MSTLSAFEGLHHEDEAVLTCTDQTDATREEFKRRFAVSKLRKNLYPSFQEWWWASDESLTLIGSQLSECSHSVIDSFLGDENFTKVLNDIIDAEQKGLINKDGMLNGGREGDATLASIDKDYRSDSLGWFHCSAFPPPPCPTPHCAG